MLLDAIFVLPKTLLFFLLGGGGGDLFLFSPHYHPWCYNAPIIKNMFYHGKENAENMDFRYMYIQV